MMYIFTLHYTHTHTHTHWMINYNPPPMSRLIKIVSLKKKLNNKAKKILKNNYVKIIIVNKPPLVHKVDEKFIQKQTLLLLA